jgi:hypothetical protein
VQVKKRNAKATILALLLGLTVGGIVIGGLVATANAQHNAGAVQPDAVSRLNALKRGYEDRVPTTGGGSLPVSRANESVLVSECKCLQGLDTVQGNITAVGGYIQIPLPLCINNDTLSSWYVSYAVVGGYTPYDGTMWFWQKNNLQGEVYFSWECQGTAPTCGALWTATFYVKQNFTLDSDQYPVVTGDPYINTYGHTTIPGKAVDLFVHEEWEGCQLPTQAFTIISAQSSPVLSNTLPILSP